MNVIEMMQMNRVSQSFLSAARPQQAKAALRSSPVFAGSALKAPRPLPRSKLFEQFKDTPWKELPLWYKLLMTGVIASLCGVGLLFYPIQPFGMVGYALSYNRKQKCYGAQNMERSPNDQVRPYNASKLELNYFVKDAASMF